MIDKNCWNCFYWQGHSEPAMCCNYLLITDKRRPCPPGKDCTVKKPRKRRRKKQAERIKERNIDHVED